MRVFSGSTIAEQPVATNRRQPIRQTRTNPARTASNPQVQGGALAQLPDSERNANPGFFPAIQHFTDAIAALPKEMIRHYTMLKEVDAKIYGPEALLGELVNQALKAPLPPQPTPTIQRSGEIQDANAVSASDHVVSVLDPANASRLGEPSQPNGQDDPAQWARRRHFHSIRQAMADMLGTLDEKNHVLNTALDGLDKQMRRCNSSYPFIEEEISEEARYGSLTHWAYTDRTAEKKGMISGERTRRAANHAAANAAMQEAEGAAIRSEQRRDALAAKKHRNQHVDSDFDESRTMNKRTQAASKGRKAADPTLSNGVGLGIVNGGAPPSKRRKVEKVPGSTLAPDRAMASVFGTHAGSGRAGPSSPRDLSINDTSGKKKGRGGSTLNGTGRRRSVLTASSCFHIPLNVNIYRAGTNASAANSPSLASSPVVGTFSAAKDRQGRSPAPAMLQRVPSSRARQNSSQSVLQVSRNRSSSTNHKPANGNGMYGTTADVEKVSSLTGRSTGDIKSNMKETSNNKGEHLIEDTGTGDAAVDLRGGIVVGSRSSDRALKREESVNGNGRTRPPSISVSTRGGNGKQPSKMATPISASFTEPQRTRAPREIPLKRSHKKGAGLAAQLAAQSAVHEEEVSSIQGDEDEDGDEPRYCYCNEVSYGEMVGCDGDECQKEWFHLRCVGLARAPAKNGTLSENPQIWDCVNEFVCC